MPHIHRPPPDLLCYIVSFLDERRDLLSATVTCRCLHNATCAHLYEKIALDEARPFDHILAMLSPDNVGLKYIRHIRLCLNSEGNHCGDSSQRPGFKMIHAFANLLARDLLLSFAVEGNTTLPSDLMRVLYRRQRLLRNIRIDDGTGPRHLFYPKNGPPVTIDDGFSRILECINPKIISTVHLCLREMPSILASRKVLAMCRNIDRLQIDFAGYLAYGVDLDSALRSGRMAQMAADVLQYVFGCAASSAQWVHLDSAFAQVEGEWRQPLRLKQLHLKGVHLDHVARTLAQRINLSVLEELECYSCCSVDTLISLRRDDNSHLLTGLKRLSIQAPPGALYGTQVDALNTYLSSFTGLKSLVATNTTRGNSIALPMMNAIIRHHVSLRSLYVDCYNQDGGGTYVWDFESLYRLCVACTKLEELALALPGLQHTQSHGNKAFAWPGSDFDQSMAILLNSRSLTTLRILNLVRPDFTRWAFKGYSTPGKGIPAEAAMHLAAAALAASSCLLNVGVGRILPDGGGLETHDISVASQYYCSRHQIVREGKKSTETRHVAKMKGCAVLSRPCIFDVEPELTVLPVGWV